MRKTSSSAITPRTPTVMTLRGIDSQLRAALDAEARRLGVSLNTLILRLLRGALGLGSEERLSHDLDALAGCWSQEDALEFAAAIRGFEEVDASLWREPPE